jgi:quinol monooxygenase YgiN
MGTLALIIRSVAQPGRRREIYDAYREVMAPRAEANEAQEVVVWCNDAADPDQFTLFEVYRDHAALGANAQAPWFAEYMGRVGPLLAAEPEVTMATPEWSTGLGS